MACNTVGLVGYTAMTSDGQSLTHPAVREFMRKIGKGWRAWSPEKRSVMGRINARKSWITRRLKYGPSGQKPNNYGKWRRDRGMPPVNEPGEL